MFVDASGMILVVSPFVCVGDPRAFDVHEVAMLFNGSSHQGDRRKTSQQCISTSHIFPFNTGQTFCIFSSGLAVTCGSHKNLQFLQSKAMLGSIAGIERSRVNELQNPEEDKPLAPHWRVPCLYIIKF